LSTKSNNLIKRLTSRSLAGLAFAVSLVAALVTLALSLGVEAVVGVSSLVAQVGVDANKLQRIQVSTIPQTSHQLHPPTTYLATVLSNNTSHVDLARALAVALAVAARAVDFAVVLGVEVDDVHGAAAVVLDDLVRCVVGAAADDVGRAVALEADGVFADVFEPDEFEVAGSCGGLELVMLWLTGWFGVGVWDGLCG
jgi:hypothetical protein